MALFEDFGQKVDLTARIRDILNNYPEGTTILKELLQNADDAGAREVVFCLDAREHGRESLVDEHMAGFQGPALLVFNDAKFSDKDFESIRSVGNSGKRDQAAKAGRFGIGFNSVYHLTDLPSFVSRQFVAFFDPHCSFLGKASSREPGAWVDFVSSGVLDSARDQFSPYVAFGCNMRQEFKGTLFRFPLRTQEQAMTSKLSKSQHSGNSMATLLQTFETEASSSLLFLKNVESLKIMEWSAGEGAPGLTFSCSLSDMDCQRRQHRAFFTTSTLAFCSGQASIAAASVYDAVFVSTRRASGARRPALEWEERYLVSQRMDSIAGTTGAMVAEGKQSFGLHLVPWVSLAARVSTTKPGDGALEGRAFCFLPLPVCPSSLRFHVNGYFELTSNRRDIWTGRDMDGAGKFKAQWNASLLSDVAAPAWLDLVIRARTVMGPTEAYFSLFPPQGMGSLWDGMVGSIYRLCAASEVVYTPAVEDILAGDESAWGQQGRWIKPDEAAARDEGTPFTAELERALVREGALGPDSRRVVRVPSHVRRTVLASQHVTPDLVRQQMRRVDVAHKGAEQREDALVLLQYCLRGVTSATGVTALSGIRLIPLADGSLGEFQAQRIRGNEIIVLQTGVLGDLGEDLLQHSAVRGAVVDRGTLRKVGLLQRFEELAQSPRGSGNLCMLDGALLAQCMGKWMCRPANGLPVLWSAASPSLPSDKWLQAFWRYVQATRTDLTAFLNLPLLPTEQGSLCPLTSHRPLVFSARGLTSTVVRVAVNLGCATLRQDMDLGLLAAYVLPGNPAGVLGALQNGALVKNQQVSQLSWSSLDTQAKRDLRRFLLLDWGNGQGAQHLRPVLQALPLFEVYTGGGGVPAFVDIGARQLFLAPVGVDNALLDRTFISSPEEERQALQHLGVQVLSKSSFLRRHVLPRLGALHSHTRDNAVLAMLQDLSQLWAEDSSLLDVLKGWAFVPSAAHGGQGQGAFLRRPEELYDPECQDASLLQGAKWFPAKGYRAPNILGALKTVGLRCRLTPHTVLEVAKEIETAFPTSSQGALQRGKQLLQLMSRQSESLACSLAETGPSNFWSTLKSIKWCPAFVHPPDLPSLLPWPAAPYPSVLAPVTAPADVRPRQDMWLCSASFRVLDGEAGSFLAERLGWAQPVGAAALASQLVELGKKAQVDVPRASQQLAVTIPVLYSSLSQLVAAGGGDSVKSILKGQPWVWTGHGLCSAEACSLEGVQGLSPYHWIIPSDMGAFEALFEALGVKRNLSANDCSRVLSDIATGAAGSPLRKPLLDATVSLAQYLAGLDETAPGVVHLPNNQGVLKAAGQLVYNDAPWVKGAAATVERAGSGLSFVCSTLSNTVAARLGVLSLCTVLVRESGAHTLQMDARLSQAVSAGEVSAFGQHEALTTRLKHILKMYAQGPGVLCELLQNADDAGASEVAFLLDYRRHPTNQLLSPAMEQWQGPALYAYNNAVFSHEDLEAISNIGQEGKTEKASCIGRFGLGFNAVYHFTDLPSFVTGQTLVMFDPHASHVPAATVHQPGLRMKFPGNSLLQQFPDQFEPYKVFGCDLTRHFNGTVFRFPLRSTIESKIKQESFKPEDMLELLETFRTSAAESLLFLHNVRKIRILLRPTDGRHEEVFFSAHRIDSPVHWLAPSPLGDPISQVVGKGKKKTEVQQKLREIVGNPAPWSCTRSTIKTQSSAHTTSHSSAVISETPRLQEASTDWLVCHVLGGMRDSSSAAGSDLLPLAGIACRISNGEGGPGLAFSFLPLPLRTGLPAGVHVNACFEVSSSRQSIWCPSDMTSGSDRLKGQWNTHLLEDVAAVAYARVLATAAQVLGPTEQYYALWPTGALQDPWKACAVSVCRHAESIGLPLLHCTPVGGADSVVNWRAPREAMFPDHSFPHMETLAPLLAGAQLAIFKCPPSVTARFIEGNKGLRQLSPQLLRNLLKGRSCAFSTGEALLVLHYCLSDIEGTTQAMELVQLELLPMADGSLGKIFPFSGVASAVVLPTNTELSLFKQSVGKRMIDVHSAALSLPVPHAAQQVEADVSAGLQRLCDWGCTGVSNLKPAILTDLLSHPLPSSWLGRPVVPWRPQGVLVPSPTPDWVRRLWEYLQASHPQGLQPLALWPLLPTTDGMLRQLQNPGCQVLQAGDCWTEGLLAAMHKLGLRVLDASVHVAHPALSTYVHPASPAGLLDAIERRLGLQESAALRPAMGASGSERQPQASASGHPFAPLSPAELGELRRFLCQERWFLPSNGGADGAPLLCDKHISTLRSLPVFECHGRGSGPPAFVDLCSVQRSFPPSSAPEELLGPTFLVKEEGAVSSTLVKHLGVGKMSLKDFLQSHVIPSLASLPQEAAARAFLPLLSSFNSVESKFKEQLQDIAFVPTAGGRLKAPSRLYDPSVPQLQQLLDREECFPSGQFKDPEVLQALASLGMQRQVTSAALLESARSIALAFSPEDESCGEGRMVRAAQQDEALRRSHALLAHLDSTCLAAEQQASSQHFSSAPGHAGSMALANFSDDFWREMKSIPWCPVLVPNSHESSAQALPPLLAQESRVAAPTNTRPMEDMWILSASFRVLNTRLQSKSLPENLGWAEPPSADVLLKQLQELMCLFQRQSGTAEEATESNSKQHLCNDLTRELPRLYSLLESSSEDASVLGLLADLRCIWVGSCFVTPSSLSYAAPVNFPPYLLSVPTSISQSRRLLLALGVCETLSLEDYAAALARLHHAKDGAALSAEELQLVLRIVEEVRDALSEGEGGLMAPASEIIREGTFLLPDTGLVLRPARELVFTETLDGGGAESGSHAQQFLHGSVDVASARRLGAQHWFTSSKVEEGKSRPLPCPSASQVGDVLLASGGRWEGVLFDVLEIADLGGCQQVDFIWDQQEHPYERLFQPNLAPFNGPSFTAVLHGLSLSAEDVVELHDCKEGPKFRGCPLHSGGGLLRAYHFTDVLQVASSSTLFLLDPSRKFLSQRNPTELHGAAFAYNLQDEELVSEFPDQLAPLQVRAHESGQTSAAAGTGNQGVGPLWQHSTVIRIPLRPESHVSTHCMTGVTTVSTSVEILRTSPQKCLAHLRSHVLPTLAFLSTVEKVTLSVCGKGSKGHPRGLMSVSVSPGESATRVPFKAVRWGKQQEWQNLVQQSAPSSTSTSGVTRTGSLTITMEEADSLQTELGGSQSQSRTGPDSWHKRDSKWSLASCLGAGKTRDLALSTDYLRLKLKPLAGAAVCTKVLPCKCTAAEYVSDTSGPLCLHTPTPADSTSLPASISGQFLPSPPELPEGGPSSCPGSPAPRHLSSGAVAEWNTELTLCALEAYAALLQSAHKRLLSGEMSPEKFHSLWPLSQPAAEHKQHHLGFDTGSPVLASLYSRLARMPMWSVQGGGFATATQGVFMHLPPSDSATDASRDPAGEARVSRTVCDFVKQTHRVFDVPWALVLELQSAGVPVKVVDPAFVRAILKEPVLATGANAIDVQVALMEFCVQDVMVSTANSAPKSLNAHALSDLRSLAVPSAGGTAVRLGGGPLAVSTEVHGRLVPPSMLPELLHPACLLQPTLTFLLSNSEFLQTFGLMPFGAQHLRSASRVLFSGRDLHLAESSLCVPWSPQAVAGTAGGVSWADWMVDLWSVLDGGMSTALLSALPLIPASEGRPVLVGLHHARTVLLPPSAQGASASSGVLALREGYTALSLKVPWLLPLLEHSFGVPVFDQAFLHCQGAVELCRAPQDMGLQQLVLSKLGALKAVKTNYSPAAASLSKENASLLLEFFASPFSCPGSAPYTAADLKILTLIPMFETSSGTLGIVEPGRHCFANPSCFMQPKGRDCLRCPEDRALRSLLTALGVPELSDAQVLVRFGLPNFGCKSTEDQGVVLGHILATWNELKGQPGVVESLRDSSFVIPGSPSASTPSTSQAQVSVRVTPSALLDPSNPLLARVFRARPERFPAAPFNSNDWLPILRDAGLQHHLSAPLLLECAEAVGSQWEAVPRGSVAEEALLALAAEVAGHVAASYLEILAAGLLGQLRTARFVPAWVWEGGVGRGRSNAALVSLSELVIPKDWALAWSVGPTLVHQEHAPPQNCWAQLQIQSPPALSMVIQHLEKLRDAGPSAVLSRWEVVGTNTPSVQEAFSTVLSFLEEHLPSAPPAVRERLRALPLVPVANGTHLAPASQVFAQVPADFDLAPVLFALPPHFVPFRPFLASLGMEDSPSPPSLLRFLRHLHAGHEASPLNPNEVQAVLRALTSVVGFLRTGEHGCPEVLGVDPSTTVVLDDQGYLLPASLCYCLDKASLPLLGRIDPSGVRLLHPGIAPDAASVLGVRALSHAIKQEVDFSGGPLATVDEILGVRRDHIARKLESSMFSEAVWSVLVHQEVVTSISRETLDRRLEEAAHALTFTHSLRTSVKLAASGADITRSEDVSSLSRSTNSTRSLFLASPESTTLIVATPGDGISLPSVLAAAVSSYLGLPSCLPIAPLLEATLGEELTACVSLALGVPPSTTLNSSSSLMSGNSGGLWEGQKAAQCRGQPGELVLTSDLPMLTSAPLAPFYAGQIVAWRDPAGPVAESAESSIGVVRYGRVLADFPAPTSGVVASVEVLVGPAVRMWVPTTHLFTFRQSPPQASHCRQVVVSPSSRAVQAATTSTGGGALMLKGNEGAGPSLAPLQSVTGSEVSKLSLVRGVEDLLAAAGIHVSLESGQLLEELMRNKERQDSKQRLLDSAASQLLCKICMNAEHDTVLQPCGHVFCSPCSSSVIERECPFCRTRVQGKLKLFKP